MKLQLNTPDTTLTWLADLVERKKQSGAARLIGISTTTVYRLLADTYEGDREGMIAKIEQARQTEISRIELVGKVQYIETHLASEVHHLCEQTRIFKTLNRVIGNSQIGKTTALEEYTRTYTNTYMLTLHPGTTMSALIRMLASKLGVKAHIARDLALAELGAAINHNSLIIVDECHQVAYDKHGIKTMEFLRALHDMSKCGVLLCGTYLLDTWMRKGVAADTLCQLINRGTTTYLESYPRRSDLDALAEGYNLPPINDEAFEFALEYITREGLGPFCREVERAIYLATNAGKVPTWALNTALIERAMDERTAAFGDRK